jgi:hypothetical protein
MRYYFMVGFTNSSLDILERFQSGFPTQFIIELPSARDDLAKPTSKESTL